MIILALFDVKLFPDLLALNSRMKVIDMRHALRSEQAFTRWLLQQAADCSWDCSAWFKPSQSGETHEGKAEKFMGFPPGGWDGK